MSMRLLGMRLITQSVLRLVCFPHFVTWSSEFDLSCAGIFDDSDQTSLPFRPFLVVEEFP